MKLKRSLNAGSSTMNSSFLSNGAHFTPDRAHQLPNSMNGRLLCDSSPLPRHRRLGLFDNIHIPPLALSSSYAAEEGQSLTTPAPARKHPYLAPPGTAQRPSRHMSTSTPAPFWRYAEIGNMPRGSSFNLSLSKNSSAAPAMPASGSPTPRSQSGASPTRKGGEHENSIIDVEELQDEEPVFDLTNPYSNMNISIGTDLAVNEPLPSFTLASKEPRTRLRLSGHLYKIWEL
jgi:forkhead protein FKH